VNFLFPLPGRVFPFPEPLVVHGVASCHDDGVTRVDSRTEESDEKKSVAYKPHFGSARARGAPVCLWRQRSLHTAERHLTFFAVKKSYDDTSREIGRPGRGESSDNV